MRQGRDIEIYPGSVILSQGLNDGFLITETAQAYAAILEAEVLIGINSQRISYSEMKLSKEEGYFSYIFIPLFFNIHLYSDSLTYNTFNNHGVLGL